MKFTLSWLKEHSRQPPPSLWTKITYALTDLGA